jgi:hypothetical protein
MAASMKQYRFFLQLLLAVLLIFLFFTAAFNYLVDPYGLFDTKRIEGFNATKPAAGTHVRLSKPYQVINFSPKAIIAGNSRPEMGLNPANACWPKELHPVFNLGLRGADIYMQARMLQHAIAKNDVRLVLWGLDFLDFLSMQSNTGNSWHWPPQRKTYEDRLKVNADGSDYRGYSVKKLQDHLYTLFSLDTVIDSLKTLLTQGNPHSATVRRDGFDPALNYINIIEWEGQNVLFKQKNHEVSTRLSRPGLKLLQGEGRRSIAFESVRRLLQFAQKHGVIVVLFINPYHVDYLASLDQAGLWPEFELWKSHLTILADEFSVKLWDFSGINSFSTEQVPAPGDKTTILKWFWEPAHYRREYGDLMLSRMLQRPCDAGNVSPVGSLLKIKNIDTHTMRLRKDMMSYKEEHGSDLDNFRVR